MTTPTREQVIEQAIQGHASTRMAMRWLYEHALTAGRDQGLREAAAECKRIAAEDYGMVNHLHEYGECAAAIEQLRGK